MADVCIGEDVKKYLDEAVKLFGKINVFFNNAGIEGVVKPLTEYSEDIFDKVVSVNIKGMSLGNKMYCRR